MREVLRVLYHTPRSIFTRAAQGPEQEGSTEPESQELGEVLQRLLS